MKSQRISSERSATILRHWVSAISQTQRVYVHYYSALQRAEYITNAAHGVFDGDFFWTV